MHTTDNGFVSLKTDAVAVALLEVFVFGETVVDVLCTVTDGIV